MESHLGEEVWPDKEASRRGGGADGGTEESSQGQGERKSKKLLRQAKEDAITEYRDSNALLTELGGSFAGGFDDCLHQVKVSFLDLDLSHIPIDTEARTPVRPVEYEGIKELFADDVNPDPQAEGEAIQVDQE